MGRSADEKTSLIAGELPAALTVTGGHALPPGRVAGAERR